jgi:hypothetical protein
MKKVCSPFRISIIAILFVFVNPTRAQLWGGLGYNIGLPLNIKNLNQTIKRFNSDHGNITREMDTYSSFDGLTLRAGMWKKTHFLDLGFTFAERKVIGRYNLPGETEKEIDMRTSFNTIDVSYGYLLRNDQDLCIGLGLTGSIGTIVVKQRSGVPSTIENAFWKNAISPKTFFTLGLIGRVMIWDPGVTIEPFFNFSILTSARADATNVNATLNPSTYQADKSPMYFNANMIGLKIMFSVTTR